jgi:uncharacterized membrane protein YqgA involved in biofilm formation
MTETMKVNLSKTSASLKIISTIAGAIIGLFVIYMNIDNRMDALEQEVATTKGVQQEWMRNMENNVEKIYNVVKEWER